MHVRRVIFLGLLCTVALCRAAEEPLAWEITAEEPVDYDLNAGIITATNGVIVRQADIVLSARRAIVNQVTGEVTAEGDVRISARDLLWYGDRLRYNFPLRRFVGEGVRTGMTPVFVKGEAIVADQSNNVYVAAGAMATTDDYAEPGYSIRAKTMTIVPGEFLEAKHATLYFKNTPVFYYPYYRRNLKTHPNYWVVTPGYRSKYGPYLRSSYNWYWNEQLGSAVTLDGFWKRGVGVGPDFNWKLPRFGEGTAKYYYIHDQDPGEDPSGKPIDADRQRAYFSHLGSPRTNLTLRSVVAYQSDAQIVRDFFESEYEKNVQPNTFVEVNQSWQNFSLDLLVQPRINDFYETVERLPEVKLTGLRQEILASPFYYDSDSSFGYYERKFAEDSTNAPFPAYSTNAPYAALRFDTYHQITLPWTFFNWLNVTPRVGGRYTHYGEASGPGGVTREEDRAVLNAGGEVSFKAARVWLDPKSKFFQVDGLRHIVEPSANYAYVPRPNVRPWELPQFDYELPTTRLLPIEYPDYNSIDSIDSQNVIRWGLRNKIQTKRKHGVDNVINWAVYTDWRLHPGTNQTTFAPIYSDLDVRPFSWLTLNSALRFNLDTCQMDENAIGGTLTPNDTWSIGAGYHYLRDYPDYGPDSGYDIVHGTVYYRFDQNWAARFYWLHQVSQGTYDDRRLTLYRDFRSWTGALSLRIRDNPTGPTDYTVAFTFSLKAYPRFKLNDDVNRHTLLLGG